MAVTGSGTVIDRVVTVLGYEYDRRGLTEFNRGLSKVRNGLRGVGRFATLTGGILTGAMAGASRSFGNFEESLAKIEGLVGIHRDQLEAWKGDIHDIASETARAPQELADALFFVTSAGLRGEEAMAVLKQSARGATAGLGDTVTIADLLTSAINAYGSENLTATMAVDALTEAVRLGKLESTALAGAMGRIMPVSSALGVEFNEVAGLMAAMSKTGTTAEEAVTQLNRVMLTLLKPADGAVKALNKMGISFDELRAQAGSEGLWPVLVRLKEAFGGNNQALVEIFPNIRALRGVFDLLGPQMESNDLLLREMAKSTGVLDEAFDAVADTQNFRLRQAMAEIKSQIIEIGEAVVPMVNRIITGVRTVVSWFSNLSAGWKGVITGLIAAGPIILGVGIAFQALSFAMGGYLTLAKLATAASLGTRLGLLAVGFGAKAAGVGMAILNGIMLAFPWLALAAGIIALGAVIWKFRDEIIAGLTAAWKWIVGLAEKFLDAGAGLMRALWQGIQSIPIVKLVKGVLGGIRKLLPFSDAKEGPLADLTKSGAAIPATLAEGMRRGAQGLLSGFETTLAGLTAPLAVGPVPVAPVAAGGGSRSISVTVEQVIVQVPSGDPHAIAEGIGGALSDVSRRIAEEFDSRERA